MIKKSCLLFLILMTQVQVATGEGHGATVQKAMTPKMAHTLFTEAFNAKNADQLCALFAEDAVAVNPRREGRAAICESMKAFLETADNLTIKTGYAVQSGDHALLRSIYSYVSMAEDGSSSVIKGSGIELVERQPDGSWLYILDHPHGAEDSAIEAQ